ncbi:MAG: sigma-54 dependent transcriptional regulator [Desulfobacterota bacterium]|nr:sigma-54 dependent transcriptional regulator [Thermodesulfobacteriota bacterium]MDW8001267.1 sigma-54 dependent transcriptional regulator [Deltaproteobacteria bacterium]
MKPKDVSILIVDDEPSIRNSLAGWFKMDGYKTEVAEDAYEALKKLQENNFDIALLDIKMPEMDGIELQRRIKEIDKNIITIIITAYATVETAIQAMKDGAFDYITKPIDPDELSRLIKKAIEQRRLIAENIMLRGKIEELQSLDEIIGESPAIKKVMELINTVAETDSTVMIRGESGTGKELVARAIHAKSKRRYFPIVTINCGAYPEGLLESELFGHEKGAFTGALYQRKGKLEMANKGTLFLDEVGNISLKMQMDLLRVLETKKFTRLGGDKVIEADFRVISATNRDLEQAVREGSFREDLYYRLNVFTIFLPPLRERKSDIPLLTYHFIKKFSLSMNKDVKEISKEAMNLLMDYDWPGNVRELRNVIERAMVNVKGSRIEVDDLYFSISSPYPKPEGETLEDVEKAHIKKILNKTGWNITKAAEILNIDRVTLYNKIEKYKLRK